MFTAIQSLSLFCSLVILGLGKLGAPLGVSDRVKSEKCRVMVVTGHEYIYRVRTVRTLADAGADNFLISFNRLEVNFSDVDLSLVIADGQHDKGAFLSQDEDSSTRQG